MPSEVFLWELRASYKAPPETRIKKLLKSAGLSKAVHNGDLTAVKIHFGERGNTGYINPQSIRPIIALLRKIGAKPFLTDTCTLYAGQRGDAVSHNLLAADHGFDPNIIGAPCIIADGLRGEYEVTVPFDGKYLEQAHIAAMIDSADAMVVLSHFKGHASAGIGGAIKNVAMGCASRRGKMLQHNISLPVVHPKKCKGCGLCVRLCGSGALSLDEDKRIVLDGSRCVRCGACFHVCETHGIGINWQESGSEFCKRLAEHAAALLQRRSKPVLFVNVIRDVTPECDCVPYSDAPLCQDIGIAASLDPVALDKACLDLVNAAQPIYPSKLPEGIVPGMNKFFAVHPSVPEDYGLQYAQDIGMGSLSYSLKRI